MFLFQLTIASLAVIDIQFRNKLTLPSWHIGQKNRPSNNECKFDTDVQHTHICTLANLF